MLPEICDKLDYDNSKNAQNELHDALKKAFTDGSLAGLTNKDFMEYITNIHAYMASEHGIVLRYPNERQDLDEIELKDML